jgi:hypothetical protein
MGYELSIEREGGIDVEEWRSALVRVPHVTEVTEPFRAVNSRTGQVITIDNRPGDAAVETEGERVGTFRWAHGRAVFKAFNDLDARDHPVRRAATQLAAILRARIVGDGGEEYRWNDD